MTILEELSCNKRVRGGVFYACIDRPKNPRSSLTIGDLIIQKREIGEAQTATYVELQQYD